MKRLLCLVLLCLLLLLGGCATLSSMPVRTLENVSLPASVDTSVFTEDVPAALYFRYWDEPYLACEWRFITRTNSQSYELALLEELLSGPSAGSTELTPLFPVGTRILSVVRQGRTLFVTLSPEIMGRYADEPVDWQEYEYWLTEAPLRRRLCMQSIVATVTENCNVDQVQILVEQTGSVTGSLRLKQNYFLDDSEDDVLVGPMTRRDDMLLNCEQSMHHFLSLLQAKDWEKRCRCLSANDAMTAMERPSYNDFVAQMKTLPTLTEFSASTPTVSLDGQDAIIQVTGFVTLSNLHRVELSPRVFRMTRQDGLWKVSLAQVTEWMEVE